jgi:hypothetical protein
MPAPDLPIALAKWYDYVKWVLDRVDGFPKNQRFVLGTRLADAVLEVMEVLAEATYARGPAKAQLFHPGAQTRFGHARVPATLLPRERVHARPAFHHRNRVSPAVAL